jgi:hypothetical protein
MTSTAIWLYNVSSIPFITRCLVGYFLPPINNIKISYLRAILKGEKLILKTSAVIHANVPRYKELSVKALMEYALSLDEVRKYLPDLNMIGGNGSINRDFFFGVMNTIKN